VLPTADEPTADREGASWRDEASDLVRGASGGLLFGVPLLYTEEVWRVGSHTTPGQMLQILGLLAPALVTLNAVAGFRRTRDVRFAAAVEDAIQALALGIVVTAAVLVLLRQVTVDTPLLTALGRIVNQCVPFCLGIGVARLLLEGDPGLSDDDDDIDPEALNGAATSFAELGATALGAAFVGLSIAPTDEVPTLAAAMSPRWQVLVVAASVLISYAVVFVAGFTGQDRRRRQRGLFQDPVTETLVTYMAALVVAFVLLWVFQRDLGPPDDLLARVVVLGLPAAVGGAVGRLAL
jgi:putative integral membrane protein (TIGR02587 family)